MIPTALTLVALEGTAAATSVADLITSSGTDITTLLSQSWSMATANPLLSLFIGTSIFSAGFSVFRRLRRTVR